MFRLHSIRGFPPIPDRFTLKCEPPVGTPREASNTVTAEHMTDPYETREGGLGAEQTGSASPPGPLRAGLVFRRRMRFDPDTIRRGALASGDENPLHHDAAAGRASRFGGLIASGAHTAALMAGMMATELTRLTPGVGLDFACSFRRAVRAGRTMVLEWEIAGLEPSPKLGGHLVRLEGRMIDADTGEIALTARATCLTGEAFGTGVDAPAGSIPAR